MDILENWTSASVSLPLTTLVISWVCCVVQREQVPVIYYTNLHIANIIQFNIMIFWKFKQEHGQTSDKSLIISMVGLMANVYFRMAIAIERCLVITCPQWNWIRQTCNSILVSVMVCIFCVITVSFSLVFHELISLFALGLLPGLLFIIFSAWTFKALPAATSVPTDEKRRIVGTLVLLLINYFLINLPTIIRHILSFYRFPFVVYIDFILVALSTFTNLILVFFMWKGAVDKLLSCLCCCITDNTAEDVTGYQQLHELMLQRQRERDTCCDVFCTTASSICEKQKT